MLMVQEEGLPVVDSLERRFDRFVHVALGGADSPLTTGADGRAALAITLAVLKTGEAGHPVRATAP